MQKLMKTVLANLISSKTDFKTKYVTGEQEKYVVITRSIQKKYIKIYVNVCTCQNT